ncbi:MAG: hypothetical protein ACTSVZ_05235 [Promethearchaeota archaeon]
MPPMWKGKKKTKPTERVMMCPQCHGTKLRYASILGGFMGQPRLLCPDCGYKGVVFVDVNPSDHDQEAEMEFIKENPEFLETRKPGWILAKESLEGKWIPNQQDNHKTLREWCPFCADVEVICSICRCPPEICAEQATSGWIGELNDLYEDETSLSKVDSKLYQKIIALFQQMISEKRD